MPWRYARPCTQQHDAWCCCRHDSPSLRLIYDSTAEGFLALRRAATGVLLIDHPWLVRRSRRAPLRVPDLLPALINATRAFLTIGAASLVWIWTAWPSGATFLTFAVIAITMFAPQEDAAYAMARTFTAGTVLTVFSRRSSNSRCCRK